MPGSQCSAFSSSSRQTGMSSLNREAINLPRGASDNLAPRHRPSSICRKRRADIQDSIDRRVKSRTKHPLAAEIDHWVPLTSDARTAGSKSCIQPAAKQRERTVKAENDTDNSESDDDISELDVEDGRDGSMPEISLRSSNLLFITSPKSEVNDDPMFRSDISLAGTHPFNDYVLIANAFADVDVVCLATGSMSAALAGIGAQFSEPAPFMKIRGNNSILV